MTRTTTSPGFSSAGSATRSTATAPMPLKTMASILPGMALAMRSCRQLPLSEVSCDMRSSNAPLEPYAFAEERTRVSLLQGRDAFCASSDLTGRV